MNEAEMQNSKRKNVILHGVKESPAPTPAERIRHENDEFSSILDTIGATGRVKEDGAKRIVRLG